MARVNKHKLTQKQLDDLFAQLSKLLSSSSDKNVHAFLDRLLGPEERIMLAKRLATVVLLEQNYSYNQIADILHISVSTASNVNRRLKTDDVRKTVNIIKKSKNSYSDIMDLLESILTVGGIMPSRAGLDRYRGIPR